MKHSPMSPISRAWYKFDLAVAVALVSPIGNWLAGTDHVKNILLITLLIFYLHQIAESEQLHYSPHCLYLTTFSVPRSLYQKSRPRDRGYRLSPPADPVLAESCYANRAASELKKFESFLFLTFASPTVGAALLRYATDAILGPAAVSRFSACLFALATGMRPWAHLVERLSHRTAELHDSSATLPPPARSRQRSIYFWRNGLLNWKKLLRRSKAKWRTPLKTCTNRSTTLSMPSNMQFGSKNANGINTKTR